MKTIKWFIISYIYVYSLFFSNNLALSQNLNIPHEIKFELSNSEYNKYLTRSMRAYTDGEIYGKKNIKKKYKKWVNAKILVNNKKIDAEIRILGDWKDHLRVPETSLKVKVKNDSYYGITRFNLFLPETRKGENEVFWTLLLKKINFPSLYTRMVEVNLNGNIYRAIFQEDATKEFLERNKLTETVILKANDFEFYLDKNEKEIYENFYTPSFVIDNNNFLKNHTSNFIASEAISLKLDKNFEKRVLNENFFKDIHQNYAPHGLGVINRKYIYLPYKKTFLPLYYDGNVEFLPGKTECDSKINKKVITDFKKDFRNLTKKNLTKIQQCVFQDIYKKSKSNKLSNDNLFMGGDLVRKDNENYLKIKNKILIFLENNIVINSQNKSKFSEKMLNYTFIYNDKYYNCFLSVKDEQIKLCRENSPSEYSKFISQSGRFIKTKKFKSFPINLGVFNNETPILNLDDKSKNFILDKKATYYLVNADYKDNDVLKFIFQNEDSRLFIQGKFKNTNFIFKKDYKTQIALKSARYDKNLLTGCANFFDSYFKNVSIKSDGMTCEDSVNIKNSIGNFRKIEINNSFQDALDLDFSKLDIQEVTINDAKNDCLDFSFGVYDIKKAKLKNCGDKGFSIGERSKLSLSNGYVSLSEIGIASKDDAITNIDQIKMSQIHTCLAAYKKKKEFQGSKITVNNFKCDNFKTKKKADNFSEIIILNEY